MGGTLLGAIVALGLASATPPSYTARVTLLVMPTADTGITNSDLQVAQGLTPTFAELATTGPVLDRVIQATKVNTDAGSLAQSVSTHVPVGTSLLTVSVSNANGTDAAALANEIAAQLRAYAAGGSNATPALNVVLTVVDPALPASARDGPGLVTRVGLGAAIALFLTISIAFLIENVSPGNLDLVRRSSRGASLPAPDPASAGPEDAVVKRKRGKQTGQVPTPVGYDPLDSKPTVAKAQIASRGVINELETQKIRQGE